MNRDFVVTPAHFVRYLRKDLKLRPADMRLPAWGVIVFGSEDFRTFRRAFQGKAVPWNRWVAMGRAGKTPAVVSRSQIGAPAAAITMEEMAALGVRNFLVFGACGSLVADLRIGEVVVPQFAVSEEGTSRLYGNPKTPRPNPELRRRLIAACNQDSLRYREGGTWTLDAPYRESRARAIALARRGIVAVEMEASALWAVARARGLRAASVFVVSDELDGDGWNPGFRDPRFRAGKRKATRALVNVIAGRDR